MSQFCGYAKAADAGLPRSAEWEAAARKAASAFLSRSAEGSPRYLAAEDFWLGVLPVSAWPADPVVDRGAQGCGVVAGDPLYCEQALDACGYPRSVEAVFDALFSGSLGRLNNTNGMFAAAAWNAGERRLVLATDKLANRCLYYKVQPTRIVFATSLRLLRCLSPDDDRVDEQGLAELIYLGQCLGSRTVFDGVRVLVGGEALVASPGGQTAIRSYFDLALIRRRDIAPGDAEAEIRKVFSMAVRRRRTGEQEDAFLSGGLDSRAVVAELVEQGAQVRTFCTSYPASSDVVVGQIVADRLRTKHFTWLRSPADRISVSLDPFAAYARDHFPALDRRQARRIWSGDGGSVALGHVYLRRDRVAIAAQPVASQRILALFPSLVRRPSRHMSKRRFDALAELAIAGVRSALERCAAAEPDRRLFLYYMQNDQARHLYHHFESIDLTRIELLTPFFDADFVSLITSLPTEPFLRHRLYNRWIMTFGSGVGEIHWQSYPGHEPCPHPAPSSIVHQWDPGWYRGADVRSAYARLARNLTRRSEPFAAKYTRAWILRAAMILNLLGSTNQNHEIEFARNLFDALGA